MALTELSGRSLGTQKVVIERGPVRVFAQALMDDDEAYSSDNAPVPPTFPFSMTYWGSMGVGGAAGLPIENLRGKDLPYVPRWTLNFGLNYTAPAISGLVPAIDVQYAWRDRVFLTGSVRSDRS